MQSRVFLCPPPKPPPSLDALSAGIFGPWQDEVTCMCRIVEGITGLATNAWLGDRISIKHTQSCPCVPLGFSGRFCFAACLNHP